MISRNSNRKNSSTFISKCRNYWELREWIVSLIPRRHRIQKVITGYQIIANYVLMAPKNISGDTYI